MTTSKVEPFKEEYEQKGYDAWIEQWIIWGYSPPVSSCPARYMQDGYKRSAYLRGWRKAMLENKE